MYVHVCMCVLYVYVLGLGWRLENNLWSFVSKNNWRFTHVFINVVLTLIGYRKSPKLDYCFIMSTSVVSVAVSFQNRHHWTQFSGNTPTFLTKCLDCSSAHVQTLMWARQRSFERRNLASNAQQTNEGSNIPTFIPALAHVCMCVFMYTCTCTHVYIMYVYNVYVCCMYVCMYIHTYVHMYVCTYVRTYMCTYSFFRP